MLFKKFRMVKVIYVVYLWILFFIENLETNEETEAILHKSEKKLRDYLFKNYDSHVRPTSNHNVSVTVFHDIYIRHILELNAATQTLTVQTWIFMSWIDEHLKWDPNSFDQIKNVRVEDYLIWKPDILLYNGVNDITTYDRVGAIIYSSGMIYWCPPVTLKTVCEVDIRFYPYDEHKCILQFGSWTHDASLIDLQLFRFEDEEISETIPELLYENNEWMLKSYQKKLNVVKYECCEESYKDIEYIVSIKRRPNVYAVTLVLVNIICLLTILSMFILSPNDDKRIIITSINGLLISINLLYLIHYLPPTKNAVPVIIGSAATISILNWLALVLFILLYKLTTGSIVTPVPEKVKHILVDIVGNILRFQVNFNTLIVKHKGNDLKILIEENTAEEIGENNKEKQAPETQNEKDWLAVGLIINRLSFILYLIIILIIFNVLIFS